MPNSITGLRPTRSDNQPKNTYPAEDSTTPSMISRLTSGASTFNTRSRKNCA